MAIPGSVNNWVQYGRGYAASFLGADYSVFRLGPGTNGSIIAGTPVSTIARGVFARWKREMDIENEVFNLLTGAMTMDCRNLKVGDALVDNAAIGLPDPFSIYMIADLRAYRQNVVIRCEQTAVITIPTPHAGGAGSMPASGSVYQPNYGGVDKANEQVIMLQNGVYTIGGGPAASIPMGIQPLNKIGHHHVFNLPTDIKRQMFTGYCPLLPGVQLYETMICNMSNGDRYEIVQFYFTSVGLQGYMLLLEKVNV